MFLLLVTSCQLTPFHDEPVSNPVDLPDALTFASHRLDVEFEPTVVLWGRQARLDLEAVVRKAVARIQSELAAPPVRIRIQAGSYRTIPDVGIGGYTSPVSGEISITMDQRSPIGLKTLLTTWLPLALAHELHHAKRILDGPGYGTTLLEAIVTEGGAEAFVRALYPDAPVIPWVKPLSPTKEGEVWRRVRREGGKLDDDYLHSAWFFGGDDLPRWAGYKIGYAIARAYLERSPDRTAAELALVPYADVLEDFRD